MSPEAPGCILGHFSLAANNDNYIKNGINREHSGTTDKEWLFRSYKEKELFRLTILKALFFSGDKFDTFHIILSFKQQNVIF